MRRAFFIFVLLAVVAAGGCVVNTNNGAPTPAPMPTAEPLPTAEPVPTAEPLPTMQPAATPVPPSPGDPIVGTWLWQGANNTVTIYSFSDDGTFQRRDEEQNMTVYMGVWERTGPETYQLIYNTPTPGIAKETVTYYPSAARLESNQTFYSRI